MPGADDSTGTLVFACSHCGSHVESRVTDFESTGYGALQPAPGIPAQRLEAESALDDHQGAGSPPRSTVG